MDLLSYEFENTSKCLIVSIKPKKEFLTAGFNKVFYYKLKNQLPEDFYNKSLEGKNMFLYEWASNKNPFKEVDFEVLFLLEIFFEVESYSYYDLNNFKKEEKNKEFSKAFEWLKNLKVSENEQDFLNKIIDRIENPLLGVLMLKKN